jgi:hypothetical protein
LERKYNHSIRLQDFLAANITAGDISKYTQEIAESTIYTALNEYFKARNWKDKAPKLEDPIFIGELPSDAYFKLLPGSTMLSSIDRMLGEAISKPKDYNFNIKKFACWHHLFYLLHKEHKFDFILIDLNPSSSNLNYLCMLSADYVIPSVGTGLYDISSSYAFLKTGLRDISKLGRDVLASMHPGTMNLSPEEEVDFKQFIEEETSNNGVYPCIPAGTSTLPRLPVILPFLVGKFGKATKSYKVRMPGKTELTAVRTTRPNNLNHEIQDQHEQRTRSLINDSAPNPLRATVTSAATQSIKDLIAVVKDAYTHYETGPHLGGAYAHMNARIRDAFYATRVPPLSPRLTAEQRRYQIARAMVIPFVCESEAILNYR